MAVRKKRVFYATDEEYKMFAEYAESKERSVSEFARASMKAEMKKTKKRAENRAKIKKLSLDTISRV